MGIASRAVAGHVGYHTPVAGERLARRAGSMYDKNELRLVTKVVILCLLDSPSSPASYVTRGRWSSTIALSRPGKAPTNEVRVGKNVL